jgi:hypothetical protein
MDKWNGWYLNLSKDTLSSFVYGDTITYEKGYEFLKSCSIIEDWGCGTGGFKRFVLNTPNKYLGVDDSNTPMADIKADLVEYRSNVDGIFMRHVLEHNYQWKKVLENAIQSFNNKMCLVLFTPFSDTTVEIAHNLKHGVDVPDLSLSKSELIDIFNSYNLKYDIDTFNTSTGYNVEYVIYLSK